MAATGQIIHMRNVPGDTGPNTDDNRALDVPLPLLMMDGTMSEIPKDWIWNGASVPWAFRGLYPQHSHPIASCRHDYRCAKARSAAQRKFADQQFEIDTGTTSWWITKKIGYIGVRIGAFLGIGSNYRKRFDPAEVHEAYYERDRLRHELDMSKEPANVITPDTDYYGPDNKRMHDR